MTRYWRIAILALFLFGCSVAEGGPENVARTEFEKWAKNRGKQYQNVQVSVAKNDGTYTAVRIIAGFREAPSLPWIEEEVTAECHKVVDKWYCDTLILLVDPAQVKAETDAPMVIVPAGNFYMGVSELKIGSEFRERHEQLDEMPQHWVYLDTFWVEKYEVTNKLYKKCVDAGKCSAPKSSSSATRSSYYGNIEYHNYPVINVSWYDASSYCTWAGRRLPTEAEWEKAAGGYFPWGRRWLIRDDKRRLNSCDLECPLDWRDPYSYDGYADTSPVGAFPAGMSPYGALDMAGNVFEWVADWYDANYYESSPARNPKGPDSGQSRVLRGGSWRSNVQSFAAVYRGTGSPASWYNDVGFRCVE